MKKMIVFAETNQYTEQAKLLGQRIGAEVLTGAEMANPSEVVLYVGNGGLSLRKGGLSVQGDFMRLVSRIRQSNLERELLVKAARLKGFEGTPGVLDATAGLGEDSFLLAAAGYEVLLYEKDSIIALLLEDALHRAAAVPELAAIISRMHLHTEDSVDALRRIKSEQADKPDIVYLDPMFPERAKSALVKKKFQLLHHLEAPCNDEESLFEAAMQLHPRKVIVKRPVKGPALAGKKPDYSYTGKAVRYDVYL